MPEDAIAAVRKVVGNQELPPHLDIAHVGRAGGSPPVFAGPAAEIGNCAAHEKKMFRRGFLAAGMQAE
jgi:hypothetical protein